MCCSPAGRDVDGLWAAFLSYLEAAQGDDEKELTALEDKLREVKQKLADKRYLQGGADVTAADLALVRLQLSFCSTAILHACETCLQDRTAAM